MSAPIISVVIVSHRREEALRRCLSALKFQTGVPFEVIIVADHAPASSALGTDYLFIPFEAANISVARNLGWAAARGEFVAFCDDDTIAEPTWLSELASAFSSLEASALTGKILGRNGFSVQWPVIEADRAGFDRKKTNWPKAAQIFASAPKLFLKLQGSNMAYRREVLERSGGFDPKFAYYFDDTDMSLRLHDMNERIGLAPRAQLHHLFEKNMTRLSSRAPRSLAPIMKSTFHFLEKHQPGKKNVALLAHRHHHRNRVLKALETGRIEPKAAQNLLTELYETSVTDPIYRPPEKAPKEVWVKQSPLPQKRRSFLIATTGFHRARAMKTVKRQLERGHLVTLLDFNLSFWSQNRGFSNAGYWTQSGGLFGANDRISYRRYFSVRNAAQAAARQLEHFRAFDSIIYFSPLKKAPKVIRFNKLQSILKI